VPKLYHENKIESLVNELPLSIQNYLIEINFHVHILKIKKNCSSESQFIKSFYNWFNAFMTLKYVHFARDHYFKETGILEAANWILKELNEVEAPIKSKKIALMHLRDLDMLN
jgi:hypothetical protein